MKILYLSLSFFLLFFFISSCLFAQSDQLKPESDAKQVKSDNQALEKRISELEAKIKELEGKIDQLTKLIELLLVQQKNVTPNSQPEKTTAQTNNVSQEKPEFVYVLKSGKKYHLQGCRFLFGEPIQMTIDDAKRKKFEPCKVCLPEVMKDKTRKENGK
jgi:HK97 family phage major capsid protein